MTSLAPTFPSRLSSPSFHGRYGVVDVGSNAVRLHIEASSFGLRQKLHSRRFRLRLGSEVFTAGEISKETRRDLIEIFCEIRALLDSHAVTDSWAVATSAIRDCRDAQELVREIREKARVDLEIIDGKREAEIVFEAIRSLGLQARELTLMDLGGGSLELVACRDGRFRNFASLQLGAVRSLCAHEEGPGKLEEQIQTQFGRVTNDLRWFGQNHNEEKLLVGLGGNVRCLTKLAAMVRTSPHHPRLLLKRELAALLKKLEGLRPRDRRQHWDLARDRADVIVPAAKVILEAMDRLGFDHLFAPKVSLKHGMIAELVNGKRSRS